MYKVVSSWEAWKDKEVHEFHEDALKEAHKRSSNDHHEDRTFYVVEVMDAVQHQREPLPTVGVEVNNETAKALFSKGDDKANALSLDD